MFRNGNFRRDVFDRAARSLDRYGHLFVDELDRVADRLDQHRADFLRTPRGLGAVTPVTKEGH